MRFLHHAPPLSGGRRVFIAIPSYGPLPTLTAFSLFQSCPELSAAGIELELCILNGHCHVDDARNHLVSRFLESSADDLLFIDADMGWQPKELVRLLSHDRDVVAGAYRQKKDDEEFPCRLLPGPIMADSEGLIEAEAVPTGMLKIRRAVLERMAKRFPSYRPEAGSSHTVSEIFCRATIDGTRIGGDYHFCYRWREMGGRIFVDPELWLEHVGEQCWQGSFGSYLRKQNGLDLAPWIARIRAGTYERTDLIPLFREWGNDRFAAKHELLAACIDVARQARGPIIETGSGLSSLVMAATGAEVHALEHDPTWLSVVVAARDRLKLDNLHVHFCPLIDYAGIRWYEDNQVPWTEADIVLCDGPPLRFRSRDVLFRVMRERGASPRLMLIDDHERIPMPTGYDLEVMGENNSFAVARPKAQEAAA